MEVAVMPPIPKGFDPSVHNTQFFDIVESSTPGANKFYTVNIGNVPRDQAFAKGLTHLPKQGLPWPRKPNGEINYENGDWSVVNQLQDSGRTYSDVAQTNTVFGLTPQTGVDQWQTFSENGATGTMNTNYFPNGPLTEQQAIQAAINSGEMKHALRISETSEGSQYIQKGYSMWGHYYEKSNELMAAKWGPLGIKWWLFDNYFNIGWPDMYYLGRNSRDFHKNAYNLPYSSWPFTLYSPGGTLYWTTGISIALYKSHPDQKSSLYKDMWQVECAKKMGKEACYFLFGVNEWRPDNYSSHQYADGILYRANKLPINPAEAFNYGFLGGAHASGGAEWGAQGRVSEFTLGNDYIYASSDIWNPKNTSEYLYNAFPHYGAEHWYGYTGIGDMFALGGKYFTKTWKLTEGGAEKFVRFRKRARGNSSWGAWYEVANVGQNDLADADYDERALMKTRIKGNVLSWYYVDPYADGTEFEIEWQHPNNSNTYTCLVGGDMVHAGVFNV